MSAAPAEIPSLPGTSWSLISFGAEERIPFDPARTPVTLLFGEDGSVGGRAGCNRFRAVYETGEEGHVRFGGIAVTRMVCPPPGMEIETAFLRVLQSAESLRLEGARLFIQSAAGTLIFHASDDR